LTADFLAGGASFWSRGVGLLLAHYAMTNDLRVLDAARSVGTDIDDLIDRHPSLLRGRQLRESAASISANIREGYGRDEGRQRNQFLRIARGSAEESDEHIRSNYRSGRIEKGTYFRIHNRLTTIVKMLNKMIT
jgi:four helix bundle protein